MPKITRATQHIFGANAPTTQKTAFGTAMTDNPSYTTDPSLIQNANYLNGWAAAIESDKAPFEEDTNGLFNLITRQLAYLFQQAPVEWDSGTEYYTNSLCTVVQDGILVIKRSLTDNNIGNNPTSDNVNWADYFSQRVIHTIGDPIVTLNPILEDNEIWLEGAEVSRATYSTLFQIYGTTYGIGDGSTTFNLPDCRNRVFWGAQDFGYIAAGLPNLTGTLSISLAGFGGGTGAFSVSGGCIFVGGNAYGGSYGTATLDASRSNSIYSDSVSTVQPPSIKVRIKTRYQ